VAERQLVIMRHARARHDRHLPDHDRALDDSGRIEASAVGHWLTQTGVAADAVLSSTSTRTRETAELVAPYASASFSKAIYNGWVEDVLREIQLTDSRVRCLLVVGHSPVVGQLTLELSDEASNAGALSKVHHGFATAAVAILRCHQPWDALGFGGASLASFQAPS
jgi:phosphohistidine phosphatase